MYQGVMKQKELLRYRHKGLAAIDVKVDDGKGGIENYANSV